MSAQNRLGYMPCNSCQNSPAKNSLNYKRTMQSLLQYQLGSNCADLISQTNRAFMFVVVMCKPDYECQGILSKPQRRIQ